MLPWERTLIGLKPRLNVKVKYVKANPGVLTHSSVVHFAAGSRRNWVAVTC